MDCLTKLKFPGLPEKERNKMLLLGISIVGSIIAVYGNVTDKDKHFNAGVCISMIANICYMASDVF